MILPCLPQPGAAQKSQHFSFFLALRKEVAAPSSFAVTLHPRVQIRLTGGGCREASGGGRPSGVSEPVPFSRAWKSR